MANLPPKPNSPATGAPVNFHNSFEDRDPAGVWRELLADAGSLISREEAMQRMIEADKKRREKE